MCTCIRDDHKGKKEKIILYARKVVCKRGLWLKIVMWQKLCCFQGLLCHYPPTTTTTTIAPTVKIVVYDKCVSLGFRKKTSTVKSAFWVVVIVCERTVLIHGKLPLEMGIGNWLCRALAKTTAVTKTWLATASLEYKLIGLHEIRRFQCEDFDEMVGSECCQGCFLQLLFAYRSK